MELCDTQSSGIYVAAREVMGLPETCFQSVSPEVHTSFQQIPFCLGSEPWSCPGLLRSTTQPHGFQFDQEMVLALGRLPQLQPQDDSARGIK